MYREAMRSWTEHEATFRTDALQVIHIKGVSRCCGNHCWLGIVVRVLFSVFWIFWWSHLYSASRNYSTHCFLDFCLSLLASSPPHFLPFSRFFLCWAFSKLQFSGKSFHEILEDHETIFGQSSKIFMLLWTVWLNHANFLYGSKDLFLLDKLAVKVVLGH